MSEVSRFPSQYFDCVIFSNVIRSYVQYVWFFRIPPGANVFDKWRKAMNSHVASSYLDTFVNPVYPPLPNITEVTVHKMLKKILHS